MNYYHHFFKLNQYNFWANSLVLTALENVGFPEAPQKVFNHILGAEFIWMERLKADFPSVFPEYPPEKMQDHIVQFKKEMGEMMASWTDEEWTGHLQMKNLKGEVFNHTRYDILTHLFNHASYHRGQISLRLREAGFEPVATDYIRFCRISN